MGSIKLFVATKAFIEHDGKVLILRESSKYDDGTNAAKYDVPGGRLEPGQHSFESLRREIKEETGIEGVKIGKPLFVNEWRPKKGDEQWQIVGIFFLCSAPDVKVKLSQDHDDFQWVDPAKYKDYSLIPNLTLAFEAYLRSHTQI